MDNMTRGKEKENAGGWLTYKDIDQSRYCYHHSASARGYTSSMWFTHLDGIQPNTTPKCIISRSRLPRNLNPRIKQIARFGG